MVFKGDTRVGVRVMLLAQRFPVFMSFIQYLAAKAGGYAKASPQDYIDKGSGKSSQYLHRTLTEYQFGIRHTYTADFEVGGYFIGHWVSACLKDL